jgi:replicative DNA helicase
MKDWRPADQDRRPSGNRRIPPHNVEAEASTLGAVLISPDVLAAVRETGLTSGDFYKPAHQFVFDAMCGLAEAGAAIDTLTVAEELRRAGVLDDIGGVDLLLDLQGAPPAVTQAARYAGIVQRTARLRQIISLGGELQALAYDEPDADVLVGRVHELTGQAIEASNGSGPARGALPGGQWLHAPETVADIVWGEGSEVLWSSGEPLLLGSYTGVGKTTLTGAILAAATGIAPPSLLGFPFQRTFRRVLYLALDRPQQIKRALRRQLRDIDIDTLDDVLRVETFWPERVSERPGALVEAAIGNGADAVIVDAAKDFIDEIDKPGGAEAWQRAVAPLMRSGVELLGLVNVRKPTSGWPKLTLHDIYGGAGFTWGAGSVLLLQGPPGGPTPTVEQAKAPAEMVSPIPLLLDQTKGILARSDVDPRDVTSVLGVYPDGITAAELADVTGVSPRTAQRRLEEARRRGLVTCERGHPTPTGATPNLYRMAP